MVQALVRGERVPRGPGAIITTVKTRVKGHPQSTTVVSLRSVSLQGNPITRRRVVRVGRGSATGYRSRPSQPQRPCQGPPAKRSASGLNRRSVSSARCRVAGRGGRTTGKDRHCRGGLEARRRCYSAQVREVAGEPSGRCGAEDGPGHRETLGRGGWVKTFCRTRRGPPSEAASQGQSLPIMWSAQKMIREYDDTKFCYRWRADLYVTLQCVVLWHLVSG
jgi:hypothetical protein